MGNNTTHMFFEGELANKLQSKFRYGFMVELCRHHFRMSNYGILMSNYGIFRLAAIYLIIAINVSRLLYRALQTHK